MGALGGPTTTPALLPGWEARDPAWSDTFQGGVEDLDHRRFALAPDDQVDDFLLVRDMSPRDGRMRPADQQERPGSALFHESRRLLCRSVHWGEGEDPHDVGMEMPHPHLVDLQARGIQFLQALQVSEIYLTVQQEVGDPIPSRHKIRGKDPDLPRGLSANRCGKVPEGQGIAIERESVVEEPVKRRLYREDGCNRAMVFGNVPLPISDHRQHLVEAIRNLPGSSSPGDSEMNCNYLFFTGPPPYPAR